MANKELTDWDYGDDGPHLWWKRLGTPEFVEQLQGLMDAARKAALAGRSTPAGSTCWVRE